MEDIAQGEGVWKERERRAGRETDKRGKRAETHSGRDRQKGVRDTDRHGPERERVL